MGSIVIKWLRFHEERNRSLFPELDIKACWFELYLFTDFHACAMIELLCMN